MEDKEEPIISTYIKSKKKPLVKKEIARVDENVPLRESTAFKEKYGDLYESSKEKRKEAGDVREKSPKPNAYSKDTTRSLIDDTPLSLGARLADTEMNMTPDIIAFMLGEYMKGTDWYNSAKLREFADMTDYTVTTPDGKKGLEYHQGSTYNPQGVLGRAIKQLFGNREYKNTIKAANKAVNSLAKDGFTIGEVKDIFHKLGPRTMKAGELGIDKLSKESIELLDKAFDSMQGAEDLVRQSIRIEEIPGKKSKYKVVKKPTDSLAIASPELTKGASLMSLLKDSTTLSDEKGIKIGEPREYGRPMPFVDSVTEFLDKASKGTWRYNKREAIDFLNEAYDKITRNGDEETLVNFLKAYNDIDFNSKKSVIDGVKKINKMYKKNYSIDTSTKA